METAWPKLDVLMPPIRTAVVIDAKIARRLKALAEGMKCILECAIFE